jgi:hypothetical protein
MTSKPLPRRLTVGAVGKKRAVIRVFPNGQVAGGVHTVVSAPLTDLSPLTTDFNLPLLKVMFTTPTAVVGLKAIVITVAFARFTFAFALTVTKVDNGFATVVAVGLGVGAGVTDGVAVPPT